MWQKDPDIDLKQLNTLDIYDADSVLILDDAPTTDGEIQPVSTQLKHEEMDEGKGIKTIVDSVVKLNETEIGNAFFRKR